MGLACDEEDEPLAASWDNVVAQKDSNHWIETPDQWIFWKVKPGKGLIRPSGKGRGPRLADLIGSRRTEALFEDGKVALLEDWYGLDEHPEESYADIESRRMLHEHKWTGPAYFENAPKKGCFKCCDSGHDISRWVSV